MKLTTDLTITEELETSRTYKLSEKTIQGFTDELDALRQAINKLLNTEKYEYPIYSFNYGIEFESLLGKEPVYVKIEIKRRIKECLLQDERVQRVDNFRSLAMGDEMICTFDVHSIYGQITIKKEVTI